MGGGGLFDPLGADRVEPARPGLKLSTPVVAAGLAAAAVVALIVTAWLRDDGDRGEPRAVSTIARPVAPPKPAAPPVVPAAASGTTAAGPGLPALRDDQDVEMQNGVRIVRPRRGRPAPEARTVTIPAPPPASPAGTP